MDTVIGSAARDRAMDTTISRGFIGRVPGPPPPPPSLLGHVLLGAVARLRRHAPVAARRLASAIPGLRGLVDGTAGSRQLLLLEPLVPPPGTHPSQWT